MAKYIFPWLARFKKFRNWPRNDQSVNPGKGLVRVVE